MKSINKDITYLKELIWRDFFSQILFNFPNVINSSFKNKYDNIKWENNEYFLNKWKNGETGYPIVDAGMRELNNTGFMHNRVRMITASFLCKHLLIDWRFGEAYFAEKLFDYELSSNNGNWQWAAGCGCDAAPYFRVFNPYTQQEKFDKEYNYIKKWVPEYNSNKYVNPYLTIGGNNSLFPKATFLCDIAARLKSLKAIFSNFLKSGCFKIVFVEVPSLSFFMSTGGFLSEEIANSSIILPTNSPSSINLCSTFFNKSFPQ